MDGVRCVDCGYLARRARMQIGGWRAHEGYHEADTVFRNNASESFDFVAGETNAVNKGEIGCYRQAADLPGEIRAAREAKRISAVDPAQEVINRSRQCSKFFVYEPGVDPPGHLVEEKAAALEDDRRQFEKTLANFQVQLSARAARKTRDAASSPSRCSRRSATCCSSLRKRSTTRRKLSASMRFSLHAARRVSYSARAFSRDFRCWRSASPSRSRNER